MTWSFYSNYLPEGPEANPASFARVPERFPGKKLLVRGIEHAPPSNVKVKKE